MTPAIVLLLIALGAAIVAAAALAWFCYRLLVERGRLLLRQEALPPAEAPRATRGHPPGAVLNDFALPALDGSTMTLSELAAQPLLLVVVQADCLYSRAFARELRQVSGESDTPLPVLVLSGNVTDARHLATFSDLPGWVLLDPTGQAARLLRVTVTPAGYLVDGERRTTSPLLAGPPALLDAARGSRGESEALPPVATTPLGDRVSQRLAMQPLAPGSAAPDVTLRLAGGGEWSLRAQRGRPVTLLFSDPECPSCQTLLAELNGVYDDHLVIVGRALDADNGRLMGASGGTRIALQERREVARAFGVLRTPAAYAIDASGRIAAGPGIGVAAALAVIREADVHVLPIQSSPHGRAHGGTRDG